MRALIVVVAFLISCSDGVQYEIDRGPKDGRLCMIHEQDIDEAGKSDAAIVAEVDAGQEDIIHDYLVSEVCEKLEKFAVQHRKPRTGSQIVEDYLRAKGADPDCEAAISSFPADKRESIVPLAREAAIDAAHRLREYEKGKVEDVKACCKDSGGTFVGWRTRSGSVLVPVCIR